MVENKSVVARQDHHRIGTGASPLCLNGNAVRILWLEIPSSVWRKCFLLGAPSHHIEDDPFGKNTSWLKKQQLFLAKS